MTRAPLLPAWLCTTLVTIALPALAAVPTGTESGTHDPATLVVSDTLHYDDQKRLSVFTGNVIMTRDLMTLHADRLELQEDAEGFQHGVATAHRDKQVYIRQERPENFETIEARGLRAEYDSKAEQIDVIGQAVVTRFICGKPFDSISGQRVRYQQKTDTYEAHGGPNSASGGGRVRSLAMPRTQIEAAVAECRQKQAAQTASSRGKP